jgi:hypothetical protein
VRPWDKTPEESAVSHAALLTYMHAGPGRSLAKVARALGKSTTLLEGWSAKHGWQARVAEWDRFLADRAAEAAVDEIQQMARRHASLGDLLVAVTHQRVAELVSTQDLGSIPVAQLPRWAHVGVLIARLSRGAASEVLAPEAAAAAQAGRTLAEMFTPAADGEDGVSELVLARAVAEQSLADRPEAEDLDLELAELVGDPEDGEDPDPDDDPDAAPWPVAAEVPEPDPDPEPPEPTAQEPPEEPPRLVVEDGRLVQRRPAPPAPDPGWTPGPPPRRARHNGRR